MVSSVYVRTPLEDYKEHVLKLFEVIILFSICCVLNLCTIDKENLNFPILSNKEDKYGVFKFQKLLGK